MSDRYADGRYQADNPTWHAEDSPWKARKIAALLELHGLRPASAVEVGCGAGQVLNALAQELPVIRELDGYDISPQAIALCRSIRNPRLRFHEKDLLAEPTPLFDVVLAIDVFEHVEDHRAFLRALRGKARHAVFHIPLELNALSTLTGGRARSRSLYGHLHFFSRETALRTLEEAGYKVIGWEYTAGAIELPLESPGQALLFWPRTLLAAVDKDAAQSLLGGWSLLVLAVSDG